MENRAVFRIGVDIGGTNIAFGIIDSGLKLIAKSSVPFPKYSDGMPENPEKVAEIISEQARRLCARADADYGAAELIGVCIPGSVDIASGAVIDAYNLGFHNVPFKKIVEEITGKPVMLQNDADAATLAEHRAGALKGSKNSVMITIGTGIGGGLIINGAIYRGGMGNGVELGHIQMDVHGKICSCGRKGCIETLCSASWLTTEAKKLFASGNAALAKIAAVNNGQIDAWALTEGVKLADAECIRVWNEYLSNLADALTNIINILDPEIIAVGGGVSDAGEMLIKPLEKLVSERCFFKKHAKTVKAALGNDAGIIGAVIGG